MRMLSLFFALVAVAPAVCADECLEEKMKPIRAMGAALHSGGIAELLVEKRARGWTAPFIPSQWHVDHVAERESVPLHAAARALGEEVGKQLEAAAERMRDAPVGEELWSEVSELMDLYEWIAATEGYGNLFIACRTLDIASVGLARLTADVSFPMEKVEALARRIGPHRFDAQTRCRILNVEAGAEIFAVPDVDEMERAFGSGVRLLAESRDPSAFVRRQKSNPPLNLVETAAIKENLRFFDEPRPAAGVRNTLVSSWGAKKHRTVVVGVFPANFAKAEALVEFRRVIGSFPDSIAYTPEQLRERENAHERAKKAGLKITNIEDAYSSRREAAFAWAWMRQLENETPRNSSEKRHTLFAAAYRAYSEVIEGSFLDQESKHLAALRKTRP